MAAACADLAQSFHHLGVICLLEGEVYLGFLRFDGGAVKAGQPIDLVAEEGCQRQYQQYDYMSGWKFHVANLAEFERLQSVLTLFNTS